MSPHTLPGWAALLVKGGAIDQAELNRVAVAAAADSKPLKQVLLESGAVLEEHLATARALELGVPYVDPRQYDIHLSNCELIPEELARRHRLFPLFKLGDMITLAMDEPGDLAVIDQVRLRANCQVDPCLSPASTLDSLIDRAYDRGRVAEPTSRTYQADRASETADLPPAASNKIVKLVRSIIEEAARDGASDIHIEPDRDKLRIRLRIDGILHERTTLPLAQHAPIVSRIKVEARLDIAETRKPQDGHYTTNVPQGRADVRVSTLPTVYGENVVLRLLLSEDRAIGLKEIGLPKEALAQMEEFLGHPHGMVLVTGPTGSGKTTTLYAALAQLSTIERNVVTVEDPVEKHLPLLRQTQVNPKAGVTFASGLRSILRQDPDVIMIGEIRDQETAEIAVQAALTGHLVLSTLHTNTAAGALVRLSEMGIPPFMITSSLYAVIAQRLARRICESCREPARPDSKLLLGLGIPDPDSIPFSKGSGCPHCLHTGYKGRVGIYEILRITPGLSKALLRQASRDTIEEEGTRALLCDLRQDGLRKIEEGLTTAEEIVRIVGIAQDPSSGPDPEQGR